MKRLHVHVGVSDLDQSIGFYSTLFAAQPSIKEPFSVWVERPAHRIPFVRFR